MNDAHRGFFLIGLVTFVWAVVNGLIIFAAVGLLIMADFSGLLERIWPR